MQKILLAFVLLIYSCASFAKEICPINSWKRGELHTSWIANNADWYFKDTPGWKDISAANNMSNYSFGSGNAEKTELRQFPAQSVKLKVLLTNNGHGKVYEGNVTCIIEVDPGNDLYKYQVSHDAMELVAVSSKTTDLAHTNFSKATGECITSLSNPEACSWEQQKG